MARRAEQLGWDGVVSSGQRLRRGGSPAKAAATAVAAAGALECRRRPRHWQGQGPAHSNRLSQGRVPSKAPAQPPGEGGRGLGPGRCPCPRPHQGQRREGLGGGTLLFLRAFRLGNPFDASALKFS